MLVGFQPDGLNILGHARLDPTLGRAKWYGRHVEQRHGRASYLQRLSVTLLRTR